MFKVHTVLNLNAQLRKSIGTCLFVFCLFFSDDIETKCVCCVVLCCDDFSGILACNS